MKLNEAKIGSKYIKRAIWTGMQLRILENGNVIRETRYGNDPYHLSKEDALATDWEKLD